MDSYRGAIVLTGASSGMGFETAKLFASNGFAVFGLDIQDPPSALEGFTFIKADVTKTEQIETAFERVKESGLRLDAIVSAAGINGLDSLLEIPEEEFIRILDVNAFSVYRVNKTFLPLLKEGGKFIMVSSELAPLDPLPFIGIYAISKSLIEKYAYSLRMEAQLLGYYVVLVRPGAVDTPFIGESQTKLDRFVEGTVHYQTISKRFQKIVNGVESKKVSPRRIAELLYRINGKKKPRYVYTINRNVGLLLLSKTPKRFQNWIIKKILTPKPDSH